jgi:hypothetical protein
MVASISNPLISQVFINLAREAFNEARANLELASVLVKNGENCLQLAVTAQAINTLNDGYSFQAHSKSPSNLNNSLADESYLPQFIGESI